MWSTLSRIHHHLQNRRAEVSFIWNIKKYFEAPLQNSGFKKKSMWAGMRLFLLSSSFHSLTSYGCLTIDIPRARHLFLCSPSSSKLIWKHHTLSLTLTHGFRSFGLKPFALFSWHSSLVYYLWFYRLSTYSPYKPMPSLMPIALLGSPGLSLWSLCYWNQRYWMWSSLPSWSLSIRMRYSTPHWRQEVWGGCLTPVYLWMVGLYAVVELDRGLYLSGS